MPGPVPSLGLASTHEPMTLLANAAVVITIRIALFLFSMVSSPVKSGL
jgi:hypothetical protein